MAGKTQLRLHHVSLGMYDDIEVINIDTGAPIPFEWAGPDMLEVDDAFERTAAIRIVPLRKKPPPETKDQ